MRQTNRSLYNILTVSGGQAFLLFVVVGVVLVAMAYHFFEGRGRARPAAKPRPIMARGNLAEHEKSIIELFRQAAPSVVFITTTRLYKPSPFSLNLAEMPRGTGSGIVWDDEGHIVTNYHVIQGAHRALVNFGENEQVEARLVGDAPDKDLAVLQIDASGAGLVPIPLGSSHDLEVGQTVLAIGNPFGFDHTLTTGVISGLDREIEAMNGRVIHGVIQTDAAINPGNSGGPLLDSAGRLIGLNTAIVSPSGAYAGIGFAVPVEIVNEIVPQLVQHGTVVRPVLGIVDYPQVTRRLGIRGVLVRRVEEGSAAAKAGIRPTIRDSKGAVRLGDIIVAIDGKAVASSRDLISVLSEYKADDQVTVTVLRDRRRVNLPVTLQAMK